MGKKAVVVELDDDTEDESESLYGFEKGNDLWKLSPWNTGGPRKFKTPQDLADKIVEYFEWVKANPIKSELVQFHNGRPKRATVYHERAMTKESLCVFLGTTRLLLWEMRNRTDRYPDDTWRDVLDWADMIMHDSKFVGAAAGIFNATVITRDLNLVERTEVKMQTAQIEQNETGREILARKITEIIDARREIDYIRHDGGGGEGEG